MNSADFDDLSEPAKQTFRDHYKLHTQKQQNAMMQQAAMNMLPGMQQLGGEQQTASANGMNQTVEQGAAPGQPPSPQQLQNVEPQ